MDNLWQGIGAGSQQLGEVNYTPGIDIGETYVATDQQLNNFTPEVRNWNSSRIELCSQIICWMCYCTNYIVGIYF